MITKIEIRRDMPAPDGAACDRCPKPVGPAGRKCVVHEQIDPENEWGGVRGSHWEYLCRRCYTKLATQVAIREATA